MNFITTVSYNSINLSCMVILFYSTHCLLVTGTANVLLFSRNIAAISLPFEQCMLCESVRIKNVCMKSLQKFQHL